jgi:hypothetical protein
MSQSPNIIDKDLLITLLATTNTDGEGTFAKEDVRIIPLTYPY